MSSPTTAVLLGKDGQMRILKRAMVIAAALAVWAQSAGAVVEDSYQCYKVRPDAPYVGPVVHSASDQFAAWTGEIKKLFMICNPTNINQEGITDPTAHLCCYKSKSPQQGSWPHVQISDQFGVQNARVVRNQQLLCNPCTKYTIIP